jgi:phenylpropionate dioxygenase-like ring-hydroxylating dioxygenase large terminal subunit
MNGRDPVLYHDWHPVAASTEVGAGNLFAARLLEQDLVIWRDPNGGIHAWEDRCPHRGTRLSIGHVAGNEVVCAYHGWHYDFEGRCALIPAHPELARKTQARVTTFAVAERYGLVWVRLGDGSATIPPFPEYDDTKLRKVVCGPYAVQACGPRIVENFLDMAHFPFVHTGILGDPARTEVRDYEVGPFDDGEGSRGIIATHCYTWQPRTNSLSTSGTQVEYTYRVVRPLTAILNKLPETQEDYREAITLHVQPVEEESSRVWMLLALTNFTQTEQELRAFQDAIFLQDKPILENQVPKRLPLDPGAELPVRCDRMSLEYRKYLREIGMKYGIVRKEQR